jgi:hypothetical protein
LGGQKFPFGTTSGAFPELDIFPTVDLMKFLKAERVFASFSSSRNL